MVRRMPWVDRLNFTPPEKYESAIHVAPSASINAGLSDPVCIRMAGFSAPWMRNGGGAAADRFASVPVPLTTIATATTAAIVTSMGHRELDDRAGAAI